MGSRWWKGSPRAPAAPVDSAGEGTTDGVTPSLASDAAFWASCALTPATAADCDASGAATASLAADLMAGRTRATQAMASRARSATSATRAFRIHGGRIASCNITPSTVTGGVDRGLMSTLKGWLRGGPFQNRLAGRTMTLAKVAVFGSVTRLAGLKRN